MFARDGVRGAGVGDDAGPSSAASTTRPRTCARPGCPAAAAGTLHFAYATREAVIEVVAPHPPPQTYDLCRDHAARTKAPHGWTLTDVRPDRPGSDAAEQEPVPTLTPGRFRRQDTISRLADALNDAADRGLAAREHPRLDA